jgi:flagellar biosynthetic protein FliR
MQASYGIPVATVLSFLMVLARVGGTFVFLPIPGVSGMASPIRAILALTLTMALYPLWPQLPAEAPELGWLAGALLSEAALGVAAGLALAVVTEVFMMAGQVAGMQAGYSFASMIDPTTQADSGVLIILTQTVASLLFFATGLHRDVIGIMAQSLQTVPPGQFAVSVQSADKLIHLASGMFVTGLRLALPVVALLLMVDIGLALFGRLNQQLQLVSLAFPAKMMIGLAALVVIAPMFPRLFRQSAGASIEILRLLTQHP